MFLGQEAARGTYGALCSSARQRARGTYAPFFFRRILPFQFQSPRCARLDSFPLPRDVPVYHLHPCALAPPCPAPASPAPALSNLSLSYARVPRCCPTRPRPRPRPPWPCPPPLRWQQQKWTTGRSWRRCCLLDKHPCQLVFYSIT
jgi:hypothetical protein